SVERAYDERAYDRSAARGSPGGRRTGSRPSPSRSTDERSGPPRTVLRLGRTAAAPAPPRARPHSAGGAAGRRHPVPGAGAAGQSTGGPSGPCPAAGARSEERRVGKEGGGRGAVERGWYGR